MIPKDPSNTIFDLAVDLVNDTSRNIFLTGKAGTGKTTFLKYIREHTGKNIIVVAPTGVAAINAGGITMHSFFQLPRGLFVPGVLRREGLMGSVEATDRHSLFRNIHFNSNKRQLIQELDLLIIDEVSMVRCDMLDAVDAILRNFRKAPSQPFGGVQVLYIGDMFQLPPVVSNEEWKILQEYYESPYFFSAKAVIEAPPIYVELKKIYRQNEQRFIDVLNRIRNNVTDWEDLEYLNSKFDPAFVPAGEDHYITITSHNKKAEAINAEALKKLPGRLYTFPAEIRNDFSDKAYPTDVELQLKVGAQVMFIKNDSSVEKRFFNGKIAVVKKISEKEITVNFDDGNNDLLVEKETWKNIRFIYSKENDDIDEEELGSFTQYPIRLAWAITIHKSQGLTFERAIIDAGASFAPGQVYVALSRCTSMEGLVLKSRIQPHVISNDKRIVEFARKEIDDFGQLEEMLEKEKYRHWGAALVKLFDFTKLTIAISGWMETIPEKKLPDISGALRTAQEMLVKSREIGEVGRKFQKQLDTIVQPVEFTKDTALLEERMEKAIVFFGGELTTKLLSPLQAHIDSLKYTTRINKYRKEVRSLEGLIWTTVQKLVASQYGKKGFNTGFDYSRFAPGQEKEDTKTGRRDPKGSSQAISLDLFKEGKSIKEIADARTLAVATIEGHLAFFVRTGEVKASDLIDHAKLDAILKVIEEVGLESAGLIKSRLGDEISYHEIRVAVNHFRFHQKQTIN